MEIEVTNGQETEVLDVYGIEEYEWAGESGVQILGIYPYDTDIISSSFVWISGSQAPRREVNTDKFPTVFVPDDTEIEVGTQS